MFLHRQNFGTEEAVTGKTETLLYVLPGILYMGTVEKLCYIFYPVHMKSAFSDVVALSLCQGHCIFLKWKLLEVFGFYYCICLPIITIVFAYMCVVYRVRVTKCLDFHFSQTQKMPCLTSR